MPRIALVGVGNCACSLVQALSAIKRGSLSHSSFLTFPLQVGPAELDVVAAFDVNVTKVGKTLSTAIFAEPNCTSQYFLPDECGIKVSPGLLGDGLEGPLASRIEVSADVQKIAILDIVNVLRRARAEVVLLYLPVGSQLAAEAYARAALEAGCGLVNNTPAVLANSPFWQSEFQRHRLPLLGDDMKSHIGSTTIHQALLLLLKRRNVDVHSSYQLNIGGNSDFLNMRDGKRALQKRSTKIHSLKDLCPPGANLTVGPSDYIPHLKDGKVGYIRIEGTGYMGMPFSMELRLSVEDSPNSVAVAIEAARVALSSLNGQDIEIETLSKELFKASASTVPQNIRSGPEHISDTGKLALIK